MKPQQIIARARLAICEECGLTRLRRCPDCGCFMDAKTRIMRARCPRGKWEPIKSRTEALKIIATAISTEDT